LKRIGDLPFGFTGGGCNSFSFGIVLCFSEASDKECHSYDGESFKTEPSTKYSHYDVYALGSYRDSPFVTGDSWHDTDGLKTEILDYDAGQWNQADDYPFSNERIFKYATTSTEESVYVIGGLTEWDTYFSYRPHSSIVAKYSNGIWTNVGSLKQGRYGHGAITTEGMTMIIGGVVFRSMYDGSGPITDTELWEFDASGTEVNDPTLSDAYSEGMVLFLVDPGYCKK